MYAPLPPGERGDERDVREFACFSTSSSFSLLPCCPVPVVGWYVQYVDVCNFVGPTSIRHPSPFQTKVIPIPTWMRVDRHLQRRNMTRIWSYHWVIQEAGYLLDFVDTIALAWTVSTILHIVTRSIRRLAAQGI
eukprot:scaffold22868_cov219-Skeletonema_marinoi.AAC.1